MDQPKRVEYLKPKVIYLLWPESMADPIGFSNFKKLVQYVADHQLWPSDIMQRYDKILRALRKQGRYSIYHGNRAVIVTVCRMHDQYVKSSKRAKSSQEQ